MTLDPRDSALQSHVPSVMVPRFGAIEQLAEHDRRGHRYLVAEDGLWLEVRRPWLRMVALIAPVAVEGIRLPYGRFSDKLGCTWGGKEFDIAYAWEPADLDRLQTLFLHDARAALPNEFAAWGVWNGTAKRLEYRPLIAMDATPAGITFSRPSLESHEDLAIDLHSHGTMDAFFSGTDDEDDAGEVKIAVVAGRLDGDPVFATRLCCLGLYIDGSSDQVTAYAPEQSQ